LYSTKPHENNRKKVRGVCDGSTRGGKTMIHGATYAPTPHQIDFRLQLALAASLGMYLWHADVTNAFAKAERPEQMYYMHCGRVFRNCWAERNPTIPLPPDAVVPVLKNLQGHPEAPRLWSVRSHGVLIALELKNKTHAPCLYYGTFNAEFVTSFEWFVISLLHVSLKRHTPSFATCWTRIGKCLCHDTA
jgi:hypothetical protein